MANSSSSPRRPKNGTPDRSAPAGGFSINFRDLLRMFLERWWIGAAVAVPAVILFIYFQPKPEIIYRAEASLLFETRQNKVLPLQAVVDNNITHETELYVHLEQIRSETFFEALQASFTPEEIERIQKPYRDPDHPNAPPPSLKAVIYPNLNVYPRKNTTIMGIQITHRDPETAALIANRYARKYIDFNIDLAMTGTNSAIVFLRNQAEDMRKQVEEAQRNLQQYRAKFNMAALGENQNVVLKKVASLGESLVKGQIDQVNLRAQLDRVEEYLKAGHDLKEIAFINGFGSIAATRGEIDKLLDGRRLLEERYLEEHPKMKDNAVALANARQRLKADLELAVADLRSRTAFATEYVEKLKSELVDAETQARVLDKISVDYSFLVEDGKTKETAYQTITNRLNEANISAQLENTNIKIFDRALIPSLPINHGTGQLAAKAAALGTVLLLGLPLCIGFMDTRVKSTTDIEDRLSSHLLGGVKVFKGIPPGRHATMFRDAVDDAVSEAYRGLYSEIELRSKVPAPKILLITSSVPGEGKSVTAANVSAVFAAHGRRVLLMDFDLRRPSLHRMFGLPNDRGLLPWFQEHCAAGLGTADAAALGIREVGPNLSLVSAGGAVKKPTEIIERIVASVLFERLTQSYDLIVIDTPPASVFPDALLLARRASEIIYVCKFKTVRRAIVKKTMAKLEETQAVLLGIVMNHLPRSQVLNYDYHGYGAYEKDYYKAYETVADDKKA